MKNLLIVKIIGGLLLCPLSMSSAFSTNIGNELLSTQLEEILNQKKYDLMKELFQQKSFKKFDKQYLDFKKNYKNATWSIETITNNKDISVLDVKITSNTEINGEKYILNTKQIVEIETLKNKIKSYKVINEESILKSQNSPLAIKVISPNKVLTGERYEVNLIIEKPLDQSILAGGMIVLSNDENITLSDDEFGIKLSQSGGLFKYIQAPLEPGFQIISAIITHPEGIYSITKKIEVEL